MVICCHSSRIFLLGAPWKIEKLISDYGSFLQLFEKKSTSIIYSKMRHKKGYSYMSVRNVLLQLFIYSFDMKFAQQYTVKNGQT